MYVSAVFTLYFGSLKNIYSSLLGEMAKLYFYPSNKILGGGASALFAFPHNYVTALWYSELEYERMKNRTF